jgi:hypothetical protein
MPHTFGRTAAHFGRSLFCAWLIGTTLPSPQAQAQQTPIFTIEQLDQMLAPIALYPDALLSQVLMASTYPVEVVEAARWSKANPTQKGDAAVNAVQGKNWDPSVTSLVAFPQVIQQMGEHADHVQRIGDAFLAQPMQVLDSVQHLRENAHKAGNLKTTAQQSVITAPAAAGVSRQTIVIEPASAQVVFVPQYNPINVYGTWGHPANLPYYWPSRPGNAGARGAAPPITWGAGVAVTDALWGGCDWADGAVNINFNRYNSINVNRRITSNETRWRHDPAHRRGVPYRDQASRENFRKQLAGAAERADFRGEVDLGSVARERVPQLKETSADSGRGREKMRSDAASRQRALAAAEKNDRAAAVRQATQSASNRHAFDNVLDVGATREQLERGMASRQSMDRTRHARPAGARQL